MIILKQFKLNLINYNAMNYVKLIIITILLVPGYALLSIDTTYADSSTDMLHMIAFCCYVGLVWILSNYTNLFKFDRPLKAEDINSDLAKFLQEKGALEAFLYYATVYIRERPKKYKKRDPKQIDIGGAFMWDNTEQGFEYWANLLDDWNKIQREISEYHNNQG